MISDLPACPARFPGSGHPPRTLWKTYPKPINFNDFRPRRILRYMGGFTFIIFVLDSCYPSGQYRLSLQEEVGAAGHVLRGGRLQGAGMLLAELVCVAIVCSTTLYVHDTVEHGMCMVTRNVNVVSQPHSHIPACTHRIPHVCR